MQPEQARQIVTIVLAGLLGHGCSGATTPQSDYTLTAVDTLVPATSDLLGRPTELAVDERGLLYVLDAAAPAVVVLDSAGAQVRRIGSAGGGPGEFGFPRSLAVASDTVRLVDGANGRIVVFTTAGRFVRTTPAPPRALSGAVSFDRVGASLIASNGRDGVLASRFDPAGRQTGQLGRPVVPVPEVWDFAAIKRQIYAGEVPAEIRSLTLPVLGDDGAAWLILHAEALIEHYGPDNLLRWATSLAEPELAAIRDEFFATNRSDSAGNRFTVLSYVSAAQPAREGLWVLVRQPPLSPTLLVLLGPDGSVLRRVRIPQASGVRGFAMVPEQRLLYLLAFDDAAVLRARLPSGW
jgi:hypothetical protein